MSVKKEESNVVRFTSKQPGIASCEAVVVNGKLRSLECHPENNDVDATSIYAYDLKMLLALRDFINEIEPQIKGLKTSYERTNSTAPPSASVLLRSDDKV